MGILDILDCESGYKAEADLKDLNEAVRSWKGVIK